MAKKSAPKTFVGTVMKAGAYPLKEPQEFMGKMNTHRLALQVKDDALKGIPDGTYIGFGNTSQDAFLIQDENERWQVLGEGSQVTISYTVDENNGKAYYNSGKSKLTVNELVVGKKFEKNADNNSGAAQNNSGSKPATPYNRLGVAVGHCGNCAIEFMVSQGEDFDIERFTDLAKKFNVISEEIKAKHKEKNPNMSAGDLGASSGMATKAAAQIAKSLEEVKSIAEKILSTNKEIEDFILNGDMEAHVPTKTTPKKAVPKKPDIEEDSIPF